MATKLNPNMLDKQQLVLISGIGNVIADRIIEERPFESVEDLAIKVDGISWNQAEEIFEIPQEDDFPSFEEFISEEEEEPEQKDRSTGIKAIAIVFAIVMVLVLGYVIGVRTVRAEYARVNDPESIVPVAVKAGNTVNKESSEEVAEEPEIDPIPADWNEWLSSQEFQADICDPQTYVWWMEEDFQADGANGDDYDFIIHGEQQAVLWGTDVVIDGHDYGRGLVVLTEPGRYAVTITDGAYRVGIDMGGQFPQYWDNVLSCLYEGDWTPQVHTIQ